MRDKIKKFLKNYDSLSSIDGILCGILIFALLRSPWSYIAAVGITVTRPCEITLTNDRLQDIYNDLSVSFEFASLADIDPTSQTNNVKVALTNWLESCVRPYE